MELKAKILIYIHVCLGIVLNSCLYVFFFMFIRMLYVGELREDVYEAMFAQLVLMPMFLNLPMYVLLNIFAKEHDKQRENKENNVKQASGNKDFK